MTFLNFRPGRGVLGPPRSLPSPEASRKSQQPPQGFLDLPQGTIFYDFFDFFDFFDFYDFFEFSSW